MIILVTFQVEIIAGTYLSTECIIFIFKLSCCFVDLYLLRKTWESADVDGQRWFLTSRWPACSFATSSIKKWLYITQVNSNPVYFLTAELANGRST